LNKIFLVALLGICFVVSGCAQSTEKPQVSAGFASIQDSAGRSVVLQKKPERIVVLSTSFLELLYAVDGKAIGRVSTKTELVPQAAKDVPEVGFVYNVSVEKLAAMQPDLVIAVQGMHEKLVPALENSGIPVLIVKYKTLEDTLKTIALFGKLAGAEDKSKQLIDKLQGETAQIVQKAPPATTKAAILHATTKAVTIEQDTTIAGSIAKKLGLVNVATAGGAVIEGSDTVPYSLEKLVENDPDEIFVVTMGNVTEIKKRMQSDVESNPAWQTLRAVQQQKVYFLPAELFLVNPGLKMTAAVEYMARLTYPEVYGYVQ
jgi:iron complex transport system substrate-binding protein